MYERDFYLQSPIRRHNVYTEGQVYVYHIHSVGRRWQGSYTNDGSEFHNHTERGMDKFPPPS